MPLSRKTRYKSRAGSEPCELPPSFIARIREQIPEEAPEFLNAIDNPPSTSIRLNPHKWNRLSERVQPAISGKSSGTCTAQPAAPDFISSHFGSNASPVPWAQNGWFLAYRPSFTLDPLFHAGCYYVQEAGSMLLEHVLLLPEIQKNCDIVFDACAAPGGKSTLAAALFPESLIVANEVIKSRIPSLLENSIKWGTGNLVITQSGMKQAAELKAFFDLVLVDAPCSGEGLFRKDPASRREWSPENTRHCSLRQRAILMNAWETVRPGGHLIYTTCTFNPEENEHNVEWLLNQTGAACRQVPLNNELKDQITEIPRNQVIGYGIYPHRSRGEGFFLSVIHKPVSGTFPGSRRPSVRDHKLSEPDSFALKKIENWFPETADYREFQTGDRLFRIRTRHWESLNLLSSQLPVRYAGTEIATVIGNDMRPAAAAALDMFLNSDHFPHISCDLESALCFLRRGNLPVPENADTGWHLATFHGIPMGWIKNIGRRMNNYYPKEWRIRQLD